MRKIKGAVSLSSLTFSLLRQQHMDSKEGNAYWTGSLGVEGVCSGYWGLLKSRLWLVAGTLACGWSMEWGT